MAPPVLTQMCNGSGRGCFFSNRVCPWAQYKYSCEGCGVRALHVSGSPAFKGLCIECFYKKPNCPYEVCKHTGCKEELLSVAQKKAAGDVVELSSSAEGPPMASTGAASSTMASASARPLVPSTPGALQALKDEVVELREMIRAMQDGMIQALKDEVAELREMITVMQDRIHILEQERTNQAQWRTGEWNARTTGEWNDWSGR